MRVGIYLDLRNPAELRRPWAEQVRPALAGEGVVKR
jgi:hypothetical protein